MSLRPPSIEQPKVCRIIMNILSWIKKRIVEPTTWLAVGLASVIVSIMIPVIAMWLWCISAITVAAGIFMKEKG